MPIDIAGLTTDQCIEKFTNSKKRQAGGGKERLDDAGFSSQPGDGEV